MSGSIKDYTKFYKLIIPRFDLATWHDFIETNFRTIDALLYNMFAIAGFKGMWENSTTYNVGDVLFIGNDDTDWEGRLVKVLSNHTTPATGTFEDYYNSNQDKYDTDIDVGAAEEFAKLAKDWATKTNGTVDGSEYSAKYYAQQSSNYATNSANSANSAQTYKNNAQVWAEGTDEQVQALGGTHSSKSWAEGISISLSDLGETDITDPISGQFLMYNNDGYWTNTDSTASISWGGITGTLTSQTDLKNALDLKADDNNVVHLGNSETITGSKTFTSTILEQANFSIQSTTMNKGTPPTNSPIYQILAFHDKNAINQGSKVAQIYTEYNTNGLMSFNMQVFKPLSGNTTTEKIAIYYPASGSPYTYAPTPITLQNTSSNNGQIVNIEYLNTITSGLVHIADAETIYGAKTFQNTNLTQKTSNSSVGSYVDFIQNINGSRRGTIRTTFNGSGDQYSIMLGNCGPSAEAPKGISVHRNSSTIWTSCPSSDEIDSIVTTLSKNKNVTKGHFWLGNGMLVNWGKIVADDTDMHTPNFDKSYTAIPSVFMCYNRTNNTQYSVVANVFDNLAQQITTTTFRFQNRNIGSDANMVYFAIGYRNS